MSSALKTRFTPRAMAAVAAASAIVLVGAAAAQAATYEIGTGHVDAVGITWDGTGDPEVLFHNETGQGAEDELDQDALFSGEYEFVVNATAWGRLGYTGATLPANGAFQDDVLWAGFSYNEELEDPPASLPTLTVTLDEVEVIDADGDPQAGTVTAYDSDLSTASVVFSGSNSSVTGPGLTLASPAHTHVRWNFTDAGYYTLTFGVYDGSTLVGELAVPITVVPAA